MIRTAAPVIAVVAYKNRRREELRLLSVAAGAFFTRALYPLHAQLEMKKYWHVFQIGLQNTMVYRMNFFFRAAFSLIPLLAVIQLWQAVFRSRTSHDPLSGYTLAEMISYYLVVTLVNTFTAV